MAHFPAVRRRRFRCDPRAFHPPPACLWTGSPSRMETEGPPPKNAHSYSHRLLVQRDPDSARLILALLLYARVGLGVAVSSRSTASMRNCPRWPSWKAVTHCAVIALLVSRSAGGAPLRFSVSRAPGSRPTKLTVESTLRFPAFFPKLNNDN